MKKKIFIALSLLSTFALASCFGTQNGTSNSTTNETPSTTVEPTPTTTPSKEEPTTTLTTTPTIPSTTPTTTPSTVEPIVVRTKDRGTVDNTLESVDIPDAIKPGAVDSTEAGYKVKHLIENANGEYDLVALQTLIGTIGEETNAEAISYNGYTVEQFNQATILEDGTTTVEIKYSANKYVLTLDDIEESKGIVSGSGEFYAYQNKATLVAKPCIGYEFAGWYDGDTLLSSEKTYTFEISEDKNITGKFEISQEFIYFDFNSDQSSCTILGLRDGAPLDIVIPEKVTAIKENAFNGALINSVVLPTTLNEIGMKAFYNSTLLSVTLNSTPTIGSYAFDACHKLIEVFNNSDYSLAPRDYECGYLAYNALVVHNSNTEDSILVKNDDFIFAVVSDDPTDSPLLVGYDGNDKEIVLPENVTINNNVISSYEIGSYAFVNNSDLTVLTIPAAVEDIGSSAFSGCENLLEVYNLSDDVDVEAGSSGNGSVGYYAKVVHTSLDEPRSVFVTDKLSYYLKTDQNNITYATIISYKVEDKDLVIEQIGNYPTKIDNEVFSQNTLIETVTLETGVVYIGEYAFNKCINLKSVVSEDVNYIDIRAFQSCDNLTDVTLKNCETIYNFAFISCKKLRNLNIPKIKVIGAYAFEYCYSLYTITLPETLETIDSYAFEYCVKLRQVINKSNLSISSYSSSNGYVASYALDVTDDVDDFYTIEDGFVTYMDGSDKYLIAYIGDSKEIVVPDDIYSIDQGAFMFGDYTSISVPEDVFLNNSIFYQCLSLEYLDIPSYGDSLYYLFKGISYYETTVIPSSLKTLRLSGSISGQYGDYFTYFQNLESLDLACEISNLNSTFSSLSNLKNVYYEGSLADWVNISFSSVYDTPMYMASKFYLIDSEGAITLGANKFSQLEEINIPDTVTQLGDYQFYGFSIKKLVIPDSLTNIGDKTFAYCRELTNVTLNNSTTICSNMFIGCSGLKEITIPNTVEEIGDYAFADCSSLRKINLSNNITVLGEAAFSGCSSLTSIIIPSSITQISNMLFMDCYGLQKVVFEGEITSVGTNAFQNCYVLNNLTLPSTVNSIGSAAFKNCESMSSFSFKNLGITEIAPYLFSGCRSLSEVDFSDSIISVGEHAFDNCNKIALTKYKGGLYFGNNINPYKWLIRAEKTSENVEVNENCEILLESAFYGCNSLKSLIIPNTITSLGKILKGNHSIEYLELPFLGNGGSYSTLNYTFGQTSTYYNYVPSTLETVKINGDITEIVSEAFKNASGLKEVIIPSTVTTIGSYAFYQTGLESFDLKNVESIGEYAFSKSSIKTINIGEHVTSLGNRAFEDCKKLTTVNCTGLTNTCTVGSYLFNNCELLSSVNLGNIKQIGNYMFMSCTALEELIIPDTVTFIGSYSFAYSGIKNIVASELTKTIGNYAFQSSEIETVDLSKMPDGENTRIYDYAFYQCSNLREVKLPNLTTINTYAFSKCPKLESIDLPDSLENISQYAFYDSGLKSVTLPTNLTQMTNTCYEFASNDDLETVTVKSTSLNYASTSIFSNCSNIKTVVFEDGARSVLRLMFSNCSSLKSVTLASTITQIGQSAFNGCGSLTSIVIPANVTSIGDNAFSGCVKLLEVYNLSGLTFTIGAETYGKVAYYAQEIHTSLSEPSMYEKDSNGFIFVVLSGKGYLYGYDGDETEITLPDGFEKNSVQYDTYDIFTGAFKNITALKKVTISGSVSTIGESAFDGCTGITDITINNGLKYIKNRAFNNCTSLVNLSLPDTLERVYGEYVFSNCGNLKVTYENYVNYLGNENNPYLYLYGRTSQYMNTLTINANCKIIGTNSLTYLSYVTNVVIPEGVIGVSDYAFYDCNKVTSITFPTSLKYIGSYGFAHMAKLQKVLLANTSVEELGNSAFDNGLYGVTDTNVINEVTLPSTLKRIGENCFAKDKITSIVIPEGVEFIGYEAFSECALLTDIVLPSTITELGTYLFYNCPALKNIEIGFSGVTLGDAMFYGCTALTNVYYDGTIDEWMANNITANYGTPMYYATNFYLKDQNGTVTYNDNKYTLVENLVIPDGTTTIANYAFYGFNMVTSIVFPASLTTINGYAFYKNLGLISLALPDTIETIGQYAFSQCTGLTSLSIPSNLTSIGNSAFSSCSSLADVIIGAKNIEFANNIFDYDRALENVYYNGTIADWTSISFLSQSSNPMYNTEKDMTFYVLDADGLVTYNENKYTKVVDLVVTDGVTSIGQYAFYNFDQLNSVTIPSSVESIGKYAFAQSLNLKYVNFVDGIKTIDTYAFYNDVSLLSITLPSTLTSIGSYAFEYCYKLVEVYDLSSSVNPSKGSSTAGHSGCYALSIHTSSTDDSIITTDSNGFIFAYCNSEGYLLGYNGNETEITLPASFEINGTTVTKYDIYSYAFYYNKSITSVIIPEGLEVIDTYAFYGCSNLSYVVIPSTTTEIEYNSFQYCGVLYKVFYGSTLETWNSVKSNFDYTITSRTRFYYSETQISSGNYWHFDSNNKPEIWSTVI